MQPESYLGPLHTRRLIVAEMPGPEGPRIVGFGQLHPDEAVIEAIYVDPDWERQGIGTALVKALEDDVRARALPWVVSDASLNAVPFYLAQGFRQVALDHHELAPGVHIACAVMEKHLPAPPSAEPPPRCGFAAGPHPTAGPGRSSSRSWRDRRAGRTRAPPSAPARAAARGGPPPDRRCRRSASSTCRKPGDVGPRCALRLGTGGDRHPQRQIAWAQSGSPRASGSRATTSRKRDPDSRMAGSSSRRPGCAPRRWVPIAGHDGGCDRRDARDDLGQRTW
jgi:GNAT superfamily N-acetyltransferase